MEQVSYCLFLRIQNSRQKEICEYKSVKSNKYIYKLVYGETKMAVNFNQNSVFNLKPIPNEQVRAEVHNLFISGEEVECAFQTIRDQLVFTNKRIIAIDVQGITGKRKTIIFLEK